MQNNTFSTLFVGQNLIKLSAVDSTNNFLKTLLSNSEPLPEGTVIMADNQYAGRGQQQQAWHAEPGLNLTFSILLQPRFLTVDKQFLLNIAISTGINKAIKQRVSSGITVKWPNDVYHHNQKLGGVLIENTVVGNKLSNSIVGIGINVNQRTFDPAHVKAATSLSEILNTPVDLIDVLGDICNEIEAAYLRLKAGTSKDLIEEYHEALYQYQTPAWYKAGGDFFVGKITGISDIGKLQVLVADQLREYDFKEIAFNPPMSTPDHSIFISGT